MNDAQSASAKAANVRVAHIFALQQAAFFASPSPSANERLDRLKALKRQLKRYQDLLADAMSRDFGHRSHAESKMLDLLGVMMEINHAISHVRRWMKPSRRSTELLFLSNSVKAAGKNVDINGYLKEIPICTHQRRASQPRSRG